MPGGMQKKKRGAAGGKAREIKAGGKSYGTVTKTSGAKPVDAKTVPNTRKTSGRVLKYER